MRFLSGSRRLAAALVAVLALALVAGIAAGASSETKLPHIGPKALVATTLRAMSEAPPTSGRFQTSVDLGLPALPEGAGQLEGIMGLLAGTREFRVWSSRDGVRIAELLEGAERAFIANPSEAWLWDSEKFEAVHLEHMTVEDGSTRGPKGFSGPMEMDPGRAALADIVRPLFKELDDTDFSVEETKDVAGRDTYTLVIEPMSQQTLVGRIEVAIDADERVPLSVAVYPKGEGVPAVSAGFSEVSFEPIDPALFDFEPPPGAKIKDKPAGKEEGASHWCPEGAGGQENSSGMPSLRSFGAGWTRVLAVRVEELPEEARRLLPFSGTLFSGAVAERDGGAWVLFGAVPQSALDAAASRLPTP